MLVLNNLLMKAEDTKIVKSANQRTIISFAIFAILVIAGLLGWRMLYHQSERSGVQHTLRSAMEMTEGIFTHLFDTSHHTKTYSKAESAARVRVNGDVGMGDDFDAASWQLNVVRSIGDTLHLTLDSLKSLPKTEVIFDFKCVEGWNQVSHWGGVRFSDFVAHFHLQPQASNRYAGLITPDGAYYVGIDMPSMMQPQTLLCYEVNGKPLPANQGYPLRLIIPVKYGIKHLKRIGTVYFQNNKPADYWAERGYDYYAGL
jgi:hypothetical protein